MPSPLRFLTVLAVSAAAVVALAATASADSIARASGKAVKGSIRSAGKPGANTLRFKGRIGGHTLRPGRYRLTISARAMVGGASARATMAFRIVR